jgi:hypothetical protein
MAIQTQNLEQFDWVKGSKIIGAMWIHDAAILVHDGGSAYSVVRGQEYLACTPSLERAVKYIRKSFAKTRVAA